MCTTVDPGPPASVMPEPDIAIPERAQWALFSFPRFTAPQWTGWMDKARQISDLLAPTVASLGLDLLGVEYLPAPGSAVVRLYIDYPTDAAPVTGEDGQPAAPMVGIDECEQVSREVSAQLDVEDPISGNYTLEVSSPGIDRPLFTPAQFERFIGQTAKVGLKLPQENRRRLQGEIAAVDAEAGTVTFTVDGKPFVATFDNIDKARIIPDWAALGLAPVKPVGPAPKGGKAGNKSNNQTAARKPRAE